MRLATCSQGPQLPRKKASFGRSLGRGVDMLLIAWTMSVRCSVPLYGAITMFSACTPDLLVNPEPHAEAFQIPLRPRRPSATLSVYCNTMSSRQ